MKQLIFATKNPGKLANMRATLEPIGYQIVGIENFPSIIEPTESGQTAEENARIKATYYAKNTGQSVLSMDSALYFIDLPDSQQPGVNVRRIPGGTNRPSDEDVHLYYAKLLEQNGGELVAYWEYALALAKPDGTISSQTARTEERTLRLPGSKQITAGQPLESFQIYTPTGQYLSELNESQKADLWRESGAIVLQLVRQLVG